MPNKINIVVEERYTTYMLEYGNSYVYINNQGYILEISEQKLQVPIIIGTVTKEDELVAGKRLCQEDLEKLEVVLKIMESANSNGIGETITKIDISNSQNYKLILEGEEKIVHLGDATDISDRMIMLKAILEKEKGNAGEILQDVSDKTKYIFRENV